MRREEKEELFVAERDGCSVRKGHSLLKRINGRWELVIGQDETYAQALCRFMTLPDDFTLICGRTMVAPSIGVVRTEMRRMLSGVGVGNPDLSPLSIPGLPDRQLTPDLEQIGKRWLDNALPTAYKYMEKDLGPFESLDYHLVSADFNGDEITLHYRQSADRPAAPNVHVRLKRYQYYWKPLEFHLEKGPDCICGFTLQYVEDSHYRHPIW